MNSRRLKPSLHSFHRICVAVFLLGSAVLAIAAPKSLLPAFGNDGGEFTVKGQSGHATKGWLPTEWKDNSEWAAVTATYTKLPDSPDPAAGAVRIKVDKVDDGQLQLTTYGGNQTYKKGARYLVTGWVRSADRLSLNVGVRQMNDPYEWYHEQELSTGPEWKKFEFAFTPAMDFSAFVMFVVRETGTVDVAAVAVEEKP